MTDQGDSEDLNPAGRRCGPGNGLDSSGEEVAQSARLADSVTSIAGVRALAPGLRDLVATAAAKVLRRAGGEPVGVDVTRGREGVKVRIDAHLDRTRSVAEVVDEIFSVVEAEIARDTIEAEIARDTIEAEIARETVEASGRLDIDLRVVSRA